MLDVNVFQSMQLQLRSLLKFVELQFSCIESYGNFLVVNFNFPSSEGLEQLSALVL